MSPPEARRNPGGAKNRQINPASSSIPSDWYPEKSCAALTNERNATKQMSSVTRGQMFSTRRIEAAIPAQHNISSERSLLPIQSIVGANQKRATPPRK